MTAGELSAILGSMTAVILPAVKWFINDWAKKATEVESLKKKNREMELGKIREELDSVRLLGRSLKNQMNDHAIKMSTYQKSMKDLELENIKLLDRVSELTLDLHSLVKEEVKTQIIKLSDRMIMLRTKKNGN